MAAVAGALAFFMSVVLAQNTCSSTVPIYVDFHVRAIDGGINEQYGLFTGIGFPVSQNVSQWPSLSNNETTVASLDYCANSPFKDCLNHAHGYYSPDLSQNYSTASSYQPLDDSGFIPANIAETALETFNLYTHYFDPSPPNITRIPNYPITVLTNYTSSTTPWFGPAGLVGLGPQSTVLKHLSDSGLIATRSFGLYMGTAYEQSNGVSNGSLTLGGYDSGRFEGEVYNYTIGQAHPDASGSPFKVSVQQMSLIDQSNGTTTDLLTSAFDAYITTSQYQLSLPHNVQQHFADVTGAKSVDNGLNVFQLPDDFNARLTITLSSGMTITYDADWLRNVSNNSPISTGTISDTSTNSTINLFGTAFLSNVYIIANYDAQPPSFHLVNALPNAPYVYTQPLCIDTVPVAAQQHDVSSFGAAGLAGAIIGGVIGGGALFAILFWLLRRQLQRRTWRKQAQQNMKGKSLDSESTIRGSLAGAKKGKGSPSTINSELERGRSSEMATFGFDFNSQQHQAYANYLHGNSTSQRPQLEPVQQTSFSLSRTYSQFVKELSRENIAASSENLTLDAAPPAQTRTPSPNLAQQPQPQMPLSNSTLSPYPITTQYARPSTADTYETPLTPATGVPLLYQSSNRNGPATESDHRAVIVQTSKHGPFHPLTLKLTRSETSMRDESSRSASPGGGGAGTSDETLDARLEQARVGVRVKGLEVQTEFAPPPKSGKSERIVGKAVGREGGKKDGLLKKVFPPSL